MNSTRYWIAVNYSYPSVESDEQSFTSILDEAAKVTRSLHRLDSECKITSECHGWTDGSIQPTDSTLTRHLACPFCPFSGYLRLRNSVSGSDALPVCTEKQYQTNTIRTITN